MTNFTTYNNEAVDPKRDWFADAIAPQTSVIETSRKTSRIFAASILAAGMSGSAPDASSPDCFLENGSPTSIVAQNDSLRSQRLVVLERTPDPVQQLSTIQTRLGLSKVGLARACRVERQTIYDWYKEKFPPTGDNARRLNTLFRIANKAMKRGLPSLDPRHAGRILSDGKSLPELLSEELLDQMAIARAIEELAQQENLRRSRSARSIRERLGWKEPSEEQQNANLDYNLGQRGQV
jgi:DNA-binding XRE family transcriptional regulator